VQHSAVAQDLHVHIPCRTQVALDLNRNSAPGIAPLSLQTSRVASPLGQSTARLAAAPAAAAMAVRDAAAQPAKPPQGKAKHSRAVSFGGVNSQQRESREGSPQAAGDVENGWLTRPRAEAGEQLPSHGQASPCKTAHLMGSIAFRSSSQVLCMHAPSSSSVALLPQAGHRMSLRRLCRLQQVLSPAVNGGAEPVQQPIPNGSSHPASDEPDADSD